ncbi:hypothetical protein N7466_000875 [Penicillium verhagenii]|uniref:uncharacterized protein n=1 Tax=Penicillium verhagenii TaxID=1562060 RepID=UPI00254540D5|nr:uncharacterized protein N7466_000875 [Penicillium verhagenii]KAJ5947860.1 hypothetical protein N7466_000875 [Penicillium verhagenii]
MSNQTPPSLKDQAVGLLDPAYLMLWAMSHYIHVCKEAVFTHGQVFAPIFQTTRLRDEAFGRFWVEFTKPRDDPNAEPVGSSALIPPILKTARGVVLDIGPGTGTQMPLLRSKEITALYGAEPCRSLHSELRAKTIAEGVSEKYHIMPCGVSAKELIPALRDTETGVTEAYDSKPENGVFDTILCVRVLCSIPDMEKTTKELYGLLKPGGRLLVTEHVVNKWTTAKGSVAGRLAQAFYMLLGWRFYIGDCCLDRDTEKVLREAASVDGGWESVDLEKSFEWSAMPYLSGILTKKSI